MGVRGHDGGWLTFAMASYRVELFQELLCRPSYQRFGAPHYSRYHLEDMALSLEKIPEFKGINLAVRDEEIQFDELAYPTGLETFNAVPISRGKGIACRKGNKAIVMSGNAMPDATGIPVNQVGLMKAVSGSTWVVWCDREGALGICQVAGDFTDPTNPIPTFANTNLVATGTWASGSMWDFVFGLDNAGAPYVWCIPATGFASAAKKINLTGGPPALANWVAAPAFSGGLVKFWKNRLIVGETITGPRLYFSAINNPESWPVGNFIDIRTVDDEQDFIVGFEVLGEDLLVFKSDSVHVVYDSTNFTNRRLSALGLINYCCIGKFEERVYWVSSSGIYSTDGENVTWESQNIDYVFSDTSHPLALKNTSSTAFPTGTYLYVSQSGVIYWGGASYPGMWLGYLKQRDERGRIPWYFVSTTAGKMSSCRPTELDRTSFSDIPSMMIGASLDPSTDVDYFHMLMREQQTVDSTPSAGNFTPSARVTTGWHLPTGDAEDFARMVKVIPTVKGDILVKVMKDYDNTVQQTLDFPNVAVVTEQMMRSAVQGKTFRLAIEGSGFELPDLQLKYRGAK